jgi:signal peptidase I
MSPTLNPGNRVLINKLLTPHRWDLVAYRDPNDPHHPVHCKRLIGLPGDHLRFDNDQLFVNDLLTMPPSPLLGHLHASPPSIPPTQTRYHDGQTITLGPDQYFLLSTNPTLSPDSRLTGPSKRPSLIGVVDLIYWPPSKIRLLR